MSAINSNLCITAVAVVHEDDGPTIEAYIVEMIEVLKRHYRYFELLLIDNTDTGAIAGQLEALQKELPNIRLLKLSRRYEQEIAFTAALDHSIGDFVVLSDPYTDPPTLLPQAVRQCQGGLDAVIGRYNRRREEGLLRYWSAVAFYRLLRLMTGHAIQPDTSHFRVLSRRIVNAMTRIKDKERYIKYLTAYVGYKHGYISYEHIPGRVVKTRRGFWTSVRFAINVIVNYSDKPLRLLSGAGVIASFLSFLYIVFVLFIALFKNTIPGIRMAEGWASTNAFNAGMFFLLFSMLAVLSEYVLKILNETQQRPLYHIAYESNSAVLEEQQSPVNVV